ncbi:S26 family signal peptidase [Asticcacaulis sp.]|uniref:S26 family signal peptidase n=1 Tax=Asticcacaulis sp. TaxID=1872648 RepID=UPI002B6F9F5C|nr:S26 family signal peptidase [Asticcacaulis sp.]HTM81577.1 S26 family signal peptidase [Asticcacaulis sp.]
MIQLPPKRNMKAGKRRATFLVYIGLSVCAVSFMVAPPHKGDEPIIVYNASASVPVGWYRILPSTDLAVGDLVLLRTPQTVRELADQRHYLPRTVPMLKHLAAISGDQVCADGGIIRINGKRVVTRQSHDHLGRLMPSWQGCHTLGSDDVFVLNANAPYSFDSRYFGPVSAGLIKGRAVPL